MSTNTVFERIIPEKNGNSGMKKLIFCSGKVFYDLRKARADRGLESSVGIARVEQLSPFPYDLILKEVNKYPNAQLTWVQEEHKNMGAWSYIQPRMRTLLPEREIKYAGRAVSASAATGSKHQHLKELGQLYDDAFA
jgi:2-oxoglutarate dehydrogenase E1 component